MKETYLEQTKCFATPVDVICLLMQIFVVVMVEDEKKNDLFESIDTHEKLIRKYFKYRYDYKKIYLAQFVLRKASADISDEMLCSLIE